MIPSVSIIIPTYNNSIFLEEAIASLLTQTYENYEIIVVNDGSTDDTLSILRKYSPEIRIINQNNQGKSKARNEGIKASQGEFIAVMDSDDVSDKDRILLQINYLIEHKNIGVVGSDLYYMDIDGNKIGYEHMPTTDLEIRWRSLSSIPCYNIMFRSGVIKKNNIKYHIDMPYAEDYAFLIDLLKFTKAGSLPLPLLGYRLHGTNETLNRDSHSKIIFHSSVIKKAIKNEFDIGVESNQTLMDFSSLMLEGVQNFVGSNLTKKNLSNFYLDLWGMYKDKYQSKEFITKNQIKVLSKAFLMSYFPLIPFNNLEIFRRILRIDVLFGFHFLSELPNFFKNMKNKKKLQRSLENTKSNSKI